jgi:cysteine synthase A
MGPSTFLFLASGKIAVTFHAQSNAGVFMFPIFISCCRTGGTVTGVSQYIKGTEEFGLKPLKPELKTVAVEPMEQMLITEAKGGAKLQDIEPHKIQGMGAGIVPE